MGMYNCSIEKYFVNIQVAIQHSILYSHDIFFMIGSFENEEDATEFVKCKIESMFAHEHKTGEGK